MISHTSTEFYLAKAWRDLVCSVFGLADESVWFSSDPDAIDADRPWEDYIEESIRAAPAIISIQSPVSRTRPWILWECSMARALLKPLYVVVYEPSKTSRQDSIIGKLGTPLDRLTHFRGTELNQIRAVLTKLERHINRHINLSKIEDALRKYNDTVEPYEDYWVCRNTIFENRIRLVLQKTEREGLAETGVILGTVEVKGDRDSMILFDLMIDRILWRDFINHLESLKLPWPGSAARWASGLGSALQRALNGLCLEGPEGLPLYFDARSRHSYRPSVSSREDNGGETVFSISFTQLPRELTARPDTKIGILFHNLDLCQMMRLGVLEDSTFVTFFKNPQGLLQNHKFEAFLRKAPPLRTEDGAERIRDFLEKLFSIRTEFWNRGLKKDSIYEAIESEDRPALEIVLDSYRNALRRLDPEDKGTLPNPLPETGVVQEVYSELLKFNKAFYQLLHKSLGREIEKLAGTIYEI